MQRRPRRAREPAVGGAWLARNPLRNALPPVTPLSEDQIEAIHDASLEILEEIGIEFQGAAACEIFRKAGAMVEVNSGLTRIPREIVLQALKSVPPSFTLTPRNPARALQVGDNHISFSLVAGPPNVHDCVNGRRPGNPRRLCLADQAGAELRHHPFHRQPADRAAGAAGAHPASRLLSRQHPLFRPRLSTRQRSGASVRSTASI